MDNLPQIDINKETKYLYVWIDILGFSDILDKPTRYKELIDLIKAFREKFDNMQFTTKTLTISDGIVLIFKLNNNDKELRRIFENIAKVQEEFIIDKEYFLRGGMAIGTIEENERDDNLKYLISNALSKAYNFESKFVKYPIIATNEDEIKKLRKYLKIDKDLENFGLLKSYSDLSNLGKDNYLYFIDFINNIKFETILKNNLLKHQSSPKILEKYIWLYRYCNQKLELNPDSQIGGVLL